MNRVIPKLLTVLVVFLPLCANAFPRIVNLAASDGTNVYYEPAIDLSWDVQDPPPPTLEGVNYKIQLFEGSNCEGERVSTGGDGPGGLNLFPGTFRGLRILTQAGITHTYSARYQRYIPGQGIQLGECSNEDQGYARNLSVDLSRQLDLVNGAVILNTRGLLLDSSGGQASGASGMGANSGYYILYRSLSPSDPCNPSNVLGQGALFGWLFTSAGYFTEIANLNPGQNYYYTIGSVGQNGTSGYCSAVVQAWVDLRAPTNVFVSGGTNSPFAVSPLAIYVRWTPVPGAVRYAMYRNSHYWGETTLTDYIDYDYHHPAYPVYYSIHPIDLSERESYQNTTGVGMRSYPAPQNVNASSQDPIKIFLNWDSTISPPTPTMYQSPQVPAPAERYEIFRSINDTACQGTPLIDSLAYTFPDGPRSFYDENVVPGVSYYYSVRAYYLDTVFGGLNRYYSECSPAVLGMRSTLWITGRVTVDGAGVSGVRVEADANHFALSNENGNFAIGGLNGIYNLTATKNGYIFSPLMSNPVDVTRLSVANANFAGTMINTATPTLTATRTQTASSTVSPTRTPTITLTATKTATSTYTAVPTNTFTSTPPASVTPTQTVTLIPTSTGTPTHQPSPTNTSTPTAISIQTAVNTPGIVSTPTPTPPSNTQAALVPVAECVMSMSDGSLVARFGYRSENSFVREVTIGADNFVAPGPTDQGQPTQFISGVAVGALNVPLTSESIVWHLAEGEARLDAGSPRCCGTNSCEGCVEREAGLYITAIQSSVHIIMSERAKSLRKTAFYLKKASKKKKTVFQKLQASGNALLERLSQEILQLPITIWSCPAVGCFPTSFSSGINTLQINLEAFEVQLKREGSLAKAAIKYARSKKAKKAITSSKNRINTIFNSIQRMIPNLWDNCRERNEGLPH